MPPEISPYEMFMTAKWPFALLAVSLVKSNEISYESADPLDCHNGPVAAAGLLGAGAEA